MQNIKELTEQITSDYGRLSPNFRKIASFIIDNPDDVALQSMRQNAQKLKLNPSNFVRFAKQFDFAGYPEMRELFQKDLMDKKSGYYERAQVLQKQHGVDHASRLLTSLRNTNSKNLNNTFEQNLAKEFEASADILINARRIYIFGMRICFPAAFALHYMCKMMRQQVFLSEGLAGTLADDMRGINEDDAFVTIGMEPYSNDTINATRYAHKHKASIIAITDSQLSPLAIEAEQIHTFNHKGPLIPGTIVSLMALIEAITAVMIAKSGNEALETIQNSESQLTEFHTYYSNS